MQMSIVTISALIGVVFGLVAAYLFTGGTLVILTVIVVAVVLYVLNDAKRVGPAGGSALIGMFLVFGPGIVCFLLTMWGVHLYFALASSNIDWGAVRSWIFR